MFPDNVKRQIQPIEHILKNSVGMRLAGIKNDVGKNGHDLFEPSRFFQKPFIQSLHVRPEFNARHREITLEAFGEIGIQLGVLRLIHLK